MAHQSARPALSGQFKKRAAYPRDLVTVLGQFSLADGSALLLAIKEWLTSQGRIIWHHGITPNVKVTLPLNVIPLTPEAERSLMAD